jgi:hypothetical protein
MKTISLFHGNTVVLQALLHHRVRFMVVGGVAVHFYVPARTFDDLDLLIDVQPDNAESCSAALRGLGYHAIPSEALVRPAHQIPIKAGHHYAELITPKSELDFDAELERASRAQINGQPVMIAHPMLLIEMKTGTERPKDIEDIDLIKAHLSSTN